MDKKKILTTNGLNLYIKKRLLYSRIRIVIEHSLTRRYLITESIRSNSNLWNVNDLARVWELIERKWRRRLTGKFLIANLLISSASPIAIDLVDFVSSLAQRSIPHTAFDNKLRRKLIDSLIPHSGRSVFHLEVKLIISNVSRRLAMNRLLN